jgi:hypothetical protein
MNGNTLTDRYVHEVVRRIPTSQRDDVADELRATITDTVEARDPESREAAERDVLVEMGDPTRLAARYADRPLALIGSELYPSYVRLLKVLLLTVLPIVTAVSVVISLWEDDSVGAAIGDGIGTILVVGGQMIAWLTVIFALVERATFQDGSASSVSTGAEWSPDDLPEGRQPKQWSTGACAAAVWSALLIGLIIWQRLAEPYRADGEGLQVLNPDLWSGWIWPILAGLAGAVALELIRLAAGGWSVATAAWYAVAEALFAVPLAVVLFNHEFFNPEFLAAVDGGWQVPDAVYTITALSVLVISAFEVGQRFREARR